MSPSHPSLAARRSQGPTDAVVRLPQDEDVALGCECADPALQIDCWGQEEAGPCSSL